MVVVSSKRRVHRVCLEFKAFQKQCTWCRLYSKVFDHAKCFVYQKKGRPGARQKVCLGSSKCSKTSVHRVQARSSAEGVPGEFKAFQKQRAQGAGGVPHIIWRMIGPDHFTPIESLQLCVIRKLQP